MCRTVRGSATVVQTPLSPQPIDEPPAASNLWRWCVHCGYDLRGSPAGLCPECGWPITALAESPIPWVHRVAVGRWRAAWRTVWVTIRHPGTLVGSATLPIDYADAQRFRRLLIAWLGFWSLLAVGGLYVAAGLHGISLPIVYPAQAGSRLFTSELFLAGGYLLPPVPGIGAIITLVLGTTSAGFFVRPAHMPVWLRNRSVALTRYTIAPLALLPTAAVPLSVCTGLLVNDTTPFPWLVYYLCLAFGGFMLLLSVGLYVFSTVYVAVGVLHAGIGRVLLILAGLSFLWLGAAFVGLVLYPMFVGYGWVVLVSVR